MNAIAPDITMTVYLASDMSSYITGQMIHVDSGTQAADGWYYDRQTGEFRLGPG